jgi:hypothetical protein
VRAYPLSWLSSCRTAPKHPPSRSQIGLRGSGPDSEAPRWGLSSRAAVHRRRSSVRRGARSRPASARGPA